MQIVEFCLAFMAERQTENKYIKIQIVGFCLAFIVKWQPESKYIKT